MTHHLSYLAGVNEARPFLTHFQKKWVNNGPALDGLSLLLAGV